VPCCTEIAKKIFRRLYGKKPYVYFKSVSGLQVPEARYCMGKKILPKCRKPAGRNKTNREEPGQWGLLLKNFEYLNV
jgi:hypothetical protein